VVAAAAAATVLVCTALGTFAGAATPGSTFWAPHAAVDTARVALSGHPADAELQLARERVQAAAAAADPKVRAAWAQSALSVLGGAERDGANREAVRQLRNVARVMSSQ